MYRSSRYSPSVARVAHVHAQILRKPIPDRLVVLTFDDAVRSHATFVAPLLMLDEIRQAKDGKIVVLTIHGVPDAAHPWVTTPPELFEMYLHYLHDHDYTVIALRDLAEYVEVDQALKRLTPIF